MKKNKFEKRNKENVNEKGEGGVKAPVKAPDRSVPCK